MVVLLYTSTSSYLSPSKCLRLTLVLKKYKESSHKYGKPFRFIFLPNVMCKNLSLDLGFWNFFFLFHCKLNETFSVQPFNHSSGSRIQQCFLNGTRNKRSLLWLVYPSFINSGSLLFCFTIMWSCEWLNFTQKSLKTNLKNTADLLFPSTTRSLLKRHVVLA